MEAAVAPVRTKAAQSTPKVVPAEIISPKELEADDYAAALLRTFLMYEIDLICLAGYMRMLPPNIMITWGEVVCSSPKAMGLLSTLMTLSGAV